MSGTGNTIEVDTVKSKYSFNVEVFGRNISILQKKTKSENFWFIRDCDGNILLSNLPKKSDCYKALGLGKI